MPQILPITKLTVGAVPPHVLVCGDPARAEKIASHLEQAAVVTQNREYHAWQGGYDGRDVLVCSHGVGAAGAAIAFEELIAAGARQIIRVGTCGGIQAAITSGDLVIATAAMNHTGYVREVVPPGYPAVADPFLTTALHQMAAAAVQNTPHTLYSGLVITRDAFYNGIETIHTPHYPTIAQANIIAVEMECAALFVVGSLRGVQTAAILAADGNVLARPENMESYAPDRSIVAQAVALEIEIALSTLCQYTS